jgi:hypothetical protein
MMRSLREFTGPRLVSPAIAAQPPDYPPTVDDDAHERPMAPGI